MYIVLQKEWENKHDSLLKLIAPQLMQGCLNI